MDIQVQLIVKEENGHSKCVIDILLSIYFDYPF